MPDLESARAHLRELSLRILWGRVSIWTIGAWHLIDNGPSSAHTHCGRKWPPVALRGGETYEGLEPPGLVCGNCLRRAWVRVPYHELIALNEALKKSEGD